MTEPFFPLTALSEAQRAQALKRFTIIRPALEEGVSQAQVARTSKKAPSTIRLWIKRYREKGLAGLANNVTLSDIGYRLSFQEATATTALTPRTAIWRKEDHRRHACGIPTAFYSDHGSDFTSKHMEQVAADLSMELIFSQVSVPRALSSA